MTGPYKILEQVENFYKIDLPLTIKIHSVFFSDWLCRVLDNPLSGQVNEPLSAIEVDVRRSEKLRKFSLYKRIREGFNIEQIG